MPKIEIIGGGISGLALGFFAKKVGLDFKIYEAKQQCGGVISTHAIHGGLVHHGPHLTRLSAELEEVLQLLSLKFSVAKNKQRFLLVDGKISKISPNFRQFCEIFPRILRKRKKMYESLGDFVQYHFGNTMANVHIQALVNGIFACDINRLDEKIALKSIFFHEKRAIYSILKKILRNITSKTQKTQIIRPTDGFQALVDALFDYLREDIVLNHKVTEICRKSHKTEEKCDSFAEIEQKSQQTITFVTTPAYCVSQIDRIPQEIKDICKKIEYQTLSVATIFTEEPIHFEGIGCLSNAQSGILGVLFNSSAFEESVNSYSVFYKEIKIDAVNLWFEDFFCVKIINSHHVEYKNAIPIYDHNVRELIDINENSNNIKVFSNYSGQISISEIFTNASAEIEKIVRVYSN